MSLGCTKFVENNIPILVDNNIPIVENIVLSDLNWKNIDTNNNDDFWFVAYGDNKWVALSGSTKYKMFYSNDCENWVEIDISKIFTGGYLLSVTYGDKKWIACNTSSMAYSTDAENWTKLKDFEFYNTIDRIIYNDNKWIAYKIYGFASMPHLMYSYDSENWIEVNIKDIFFYGINSMAYGDGKWIAVGPTGAMAYYPDKVAYSTDLENWTDINITIFDRYEERINCIAYGNGVWLIGGNESIMAYSTDGINWIEVNTTAFGGKDIDIIVWGNDRWIATGYQMMAYSIDGKNWVPANNLAFSKIRSIAYGDKNWVIVGEGKIGYARDN